MSDKIYNVLFICTGNSARSIIAEAVTNHLGDGRFKAYSAGSHPRGQVHPLALELLIGQRYDVSQLRSKGWEEFTHAKAPVMDFVFTVCDKAAREICPAWPGQPVTADWSFEDPVLVTGSLEQQKKAFANALFLISNRIRLFLNLPHDRIDRMSLQQVLKALPPDDAG